MSIFIPTFLKLISWIWLRIILGEIWIQAKRIRLPVSGSISTHSLDPYQFEMIQIHNTAREMAPFTVVILLPRVFVLKNRPNPVNIAIPSSSSPFASLPLILCFFAQLQNCCTYFVQLQNLLLHTLCTYSPSSARSIFLYFLPFLPMNGQYNGAF